MSPPPVEDLLVQLARLGGSDLHLKVGSPPVLRVAGRLRPTDLAALEPADTEAYAEVLLTPEADTEFADRGEADFAWGKRNLGRFRVNAFRQRGSVGLAIRRVPHEPASLSDLGLPDVMRKLVDEARGLVVVTGPTGSGKTTALAGMIRHINETRRAHVVTIEDPIEVLHRDDRAIVAQREVGIDTPSFAEALRRVLRQDPDVIMVGEVRDQETVSAALKAAETGHLVLTSLHTIDATETINRIVDLFPPYQQRQVRLLLAGTLRGVVSLRLLERRDGEALVPATEVLVANGRVRERIAHDDRTHSLREVIAEGEFYGMHTFDDSILRLYQKGLVTLEEALRWASNPHDLKVRAEQEGLLSA